MSGIDTHEAVNRQMDRLLASAERGRRPPGQGETVLTVEGRHGPVSVRFGVADIEAVIAELEAGAPCGICHSNPCRYRAPAETLS